MYNFVDILHWLFFYNSGVIYVDLFSLRNDVLLQNNNVIIFYSPIQLSFRLFLNFYYNKKCFSNYSCCLLIYLYKRPYLKYEYVKVGMRKPKTFRKIISFPCLEYPPVSSSFLETSIENTASYSPQFTTVHSHSETVLILTVLNWSACIWKAFSSPIKNNS